MLRTSILGKISNLSPTGPSVPKLAGQGYQIVNLSKICQKVVQHVLNVNSRLDFKFEPNQTKRPKVSRPGLPDCAKFTRSRQRVVHHVKDVNSRPDFNFELNRTKRSKVSRSGLPDCEMCKKSSKGSATYFERQF